MVNYFYRTGWDLLECVGTITNICDLIGAYEIPLEQVTNKQHDILDEEISRASIDAITE